MDTKGMKLVVLVAVLPLYHGVGDEASWVQTARKPSLSWRILGIQPCTVIWALHKGSPCLAPCDLQKPVILGQHDGLWCLTKPAAHKEEVEGKTMLRPFDQGTASRGG